LDTVLAECLGASLSSLVFTVPKFDDILVPA
jgi:hypothetical protein